MRFFSLAPSHNSNAEPVRRLFLSLIAAVLLVAASPLCGAQDQDVLRTRGNLAILGVWPEKMIKSFRFPKDSFLVLIRPADAASDGDTPVPADTAPSLTSQAPAAAASDSQPDSQETDDHYFVCLINHLPASEQALLSDASDGEWNELSFLDAVLIADGISDEERAVCRQIYDRHIARLREETKDVGDDFEKARLVYEYLHREVLTGSYDLNRSSAAASLRTGTYNCVSATALFNALAGDVGLTSYGLEMTGHAKSRVLCGDSYLDIETTCPKWELLPDRPMPIPNAKPGSATWARDAEFIKQVNYVESTSSYPSEEEEDDSELASAPLVEVDEDEGPVTPERALALSGKKPVRTVTPVQFVATIYYNRAVDYYQAGKFDSAIYAYLKAIAIDPNNKTVLGNFKATINNLAIELASRNKNYDVAIRLTEKGLALDPNFYQFKVNLPLYYRHWSSELRKRNLIDEAQRVEARYHHYFPETETKIF